MTTEKSTALSRYDAACHALAEAKNLTEVKDIAGKMTALRAYARRAKGRQLEINAVELRVRAERRVGEMMEALGLKPGKPKRNGFSNNPLPLFGVPKPDELPQPTLAEMGIDKNLANRARKFASLSDSVLEARLAGWRATAEHADRVPLDILRGDRGGKRREVPPVRAFAGGSVDDLHQLAATGFKATAILVDPPWELIIRGHHGGSHTDHPEGLDLIKALPVAQLAAQDAVLCMWIADWCPEAALDVIDAWGFVHKTTAFIWAKQDASGEGWHIGPARWTNPGTESCWLASRGKPKRLNADVRQLIVAPAIEQSLKPDEIHDRIERLVEGPYLELFASRERRSWMTWGQEVKLEIPDAPSLDPGGGEVEIISPSVVRAPSRPSDEDGLQLPDFLRRGDPACVIGGGRP